MLQGDTYTGNWLSAIGHTPKLARSMIVDTVGLVAQLHPDKTHELYGPRHTVIHRHTATFPLTQVQTSSFITKLKGKKKVSTEPT